MVRAFRTLGSRLRKVAFPKIRLPILTPAEKTALVALLLLLSAGAVLRAWERSGVRIGPIEDWATLRDMVIRARADLDREGGEGYGCAEDAPAGRFGVEAGAERNILAAGMAGAGSAHRKKAAAGGGKKAPARPVDLNAAGEKSLLTLPGVGPSTAKAILAHRTARGPFRSVDELLSVKGIGPKKLEAIRPFARVAAPPEDPQSRKDEAGSPSQADPQKKPAEDPPKIP